MTYAVRMTSTVIRTDGELSIADDVSGYVRIRDDFREMFIPVRYIRYVERDGVLICGSYGRRGIFTTNEERIISETIDRHKKALDMLAEDD